MVANAPTGDLDNSGLTLETGYGGLPSQYVEQVVLKTECALGLERLGCDIDGKGDLIYKGTLVSDGGKKIDDRGDSEGSGGGGKLGHGEMYANSGNFPFYFGENILADNSGRLPLSVDMIVDDRVLYMDYNVAVVIGLSLPANSEHLATLTHGISSYSINNGEAIFIQIPGGFTGELDNIFSIDGKKVYISGSDGKYKVSIDYGDEAYVLKSGNREINILEIAGGDRLYANALMQIYFGMIKTNPGNPSVPSRAIALIRALDRSISKDEMPMNFVSNGINDNAPGTLLFLAANHDRFTNPGATNYAELLYTRHLGGELDSLIKVLGGGKSGNRL